MNLQLLTNLISDYKIFIEKRQDEEWQQPWKSLEVFNYHWDIDASDFARMYDDSFAGDCFLWHGEDFHPKTSMLYYCSQNADLVRSMFIDLYDEGRDIVGRIHRFMDQCDQLRTYHSKGITLRESHYHSDRRMVFVYLAFRYPDKYTLYEEQGFRKILELVNAKPVGSSLTLERYIKTSKTIDILMQRDTDLVDLLDQKLQKFNSNNEGTLFGLIDFYWFSHHSK